MILILVCVGLTFLSTPQDEYEHAKMQEAMSRTMVSMAVIPFLLLLVSFFFLLREFSKNALRQTSNKLTYQLRQNMAIASRLTQSELMSLINKRLDDYDRGLINEVLDIFCAELFKFQPSRRLSRQRLVGEYRRGEPVFGPRNVKDQRSEFVELILW